MQESKEKIKREHNQNRNVQDEPNGTCSSRILDRTGEEMNRAMEIHKEELMEVYEEAGEDLSAVWDEYNQYDTFHEYLIDGAMLTCTQATLEPVTLTDGTIMELNQGACEYTKLPNGRVIEINKGLQSEYERLHTRLNVSENGLYLGKTPYATVKDTVRDVNILPFRCNCQQKVTGISEMTMIQENMEDCKENGICKYLMWLNEEWDNMPLSNSEHSVIEPSYLSISDITWIKKEDGTKEPIVSNSEGITRTSVLFCKRGGLIIPLTSGQGRLILDDYSDLSDDEILLVTTIYGEADACSENSWRAIANIIMNRVGVREWSQYKTPVEIVKYTGFDAYKDRNVPYLEAEAYFKNRDYSNENIERMIQVIMPILRGEEDDITQNAVLYYSPETQAAMHKKEPQKYKEVPDFALSSSVEEVKITGTENDDFRFFKYID